jgi:hypothetical protein
VFTGCSQFVGLHSRGVTVLSGRTDHRLNSNRGFTLRICVRNKLTDKQTNRYRQSEFFTHRAMAGVHKGNMNNNKNKHFTKKCQTFPINFRLCSIKPDPISMSN